MKVKDFFGELETVNNNFLAPNPDPIEEEIKNAYTAIINLMCSADFLDEISLEERVKLSGVALFLAEVLEAWNEQ